MAASSMLRRQWQIVDALSSSHRGLTIAQLQDAGGASRATIYRDLETLLHAGVPLEMETVNGETRHRLRDYRVPPLELSLLQLAALQVARRRMAPLEGTTLVRELDELLAKATGKRQIAPPVTVADAGEAPSVRVLRAVESALELRRRLRIDYESAKAPGVPSLREVDALELLVREGHVYLQAIDPSKGKVQTFKLTRIRTAELLAEAAAAHPEYDGTSTLARSVKVWDAPPVEVAVRLAPSIARFATEWPLVSGQIIEPQPDGGAVVRALVAGTHEALKWVLSWGKNAKVLDPEELVTAHREELLGALASYAQKEG